MPDFTPLFLASAGAPIEVDGQRLHSSLRLEPAPKGRIHVFFERSVQRPVQGLSISAASDKHQLTVAGTSARHFVLWRDTAPTHVEIELPAARLPVPLVIHNVWRDEKYGTTMYGVNAAAMRITEEAQGKWLLECSDGWGNDANFADLVVRIVVEPAGGAA